MNSKMKRGSEFERLVAKALSELSSEYPRRFTSSRWPKLNLRNGETVVPDFSIEIDLPHLKEHYLIECQDRSNNSKSIVHKIEYIRAQSGKNNFIFLYNTAATPETARALRREGVLVFSYTEFLMFLKRVNLTLSATPPGTEDPGGGDDEWDSDHLQEE